MTILLGMLSWLPWGYNAPKALGMMTGIVLMKGSGRDKPLMLPALACLAVGILSTVGSVDPIMSVFGLWEAPFYGLLAMAMMFVAYEQSEGDIALPCQVAAGAMAILAIAQAIWGQPILGTTMTNGRVTATMGSPIYLGAAFVGLFPYLSGPLACLALLATFLTKAKGALAGIAAGCLAYAYVQGRVSKAQVAIVLVLAGLGLTGYVYRGVTGSDQGRLELAGVAWRSFKENPVLGSGPDTFLFSFRKLRTKSYAKLIGSKAGQGSAHNDILQALSTTGLLGCGAYLWLVWSAWKLALEQKDAAVAAVIAGIFVQAKFNPIPLPVHVLAAMACARLR